MKTILEIKKEDYKRMIKEQKELEANPLLAYSTSELKREIRRRKNENN